MWGLLLPIRRSFDQYINPPPARLLEDLENPLAKPGALDITVSGENTEWEYSDSGGRIYRGTSHEMAVQEIVIIPRWQTVFPYSDVHNY